MITVEEIIMKHKRKGTMGNLHDKLMEKEWYASWHNLPARRAIHWSLFIIIALSLGVAFIAEPTDFSNYAAKLNPDTKQSKAPPKDSDDTDTEYVLVKFTKDVNTHANALASKHGIQLTSEAGLDKINVKRFKINKDKETAEEKVASIKAQKHQEGKDSAIEYAEVDALVAPSLVPNDPTYSSQWHHTTIQSETAWDSVNGSDVIIAVLDSGVDPTHPDLAANLVPGRNTVSDNDDTSPIYTHGTAVAGAAAAIGNNSNQIAGVAWNAKIMPIRITNNTNGSASAYEAAEGIIWAADHGAKVANASFKFWDYSVVQDAGRYMRNKGGLVVISAGNSGLEFTSATNQQNVIVVSSTNSADAFSGFSNRGVMIDVGAPGESILTTYVGGSTSYYSGTSFSSPLTAGLLGLIYAAKPGISADDAERALFNSAKDLGDLGWDKYFGWGRIDATKAVELAKGTTAGDTTAPTVPSNVTATATSAQVSVTWTASTDNSGVTGYDILRDGTKIATVSSTQYTDTNVSVGSTYSYTVRAFDSVGNVSTASASASATIPTPTTNLQITSFSVTNKTTNSATITWTTSVPSTGTVAYGLQSGKSYSLNLSASDTNLSTTHSAMLTNLNAGATYKFQITATNSELAQTVKSSVSSFKTLRR
jgi:thermitase